MASNRLSREMSEEMRDPGSGNLGEQVEAAERRLREAAKAAAAAEERAIAEIRALEADLERERLTHDEELERLRRGQGEELERERGAKEQADCSRARGRATSPANRAPATTVAGGGLCRPAAVQRLVEERRPAEGGLGEGEVVFDLDAGGEVALGGEGGHPHRRIVHAGGS